MKIAINSGHHTTYDCGALGAYSNEADIVCMVSHLVCSYLTDAGHEAFFIMENELEDICAEANEEQADLFVAIHCNAAADESAHGTETFYYEEGDESYEMALCIQQNIVESMGTVDRGVKDGSRFYVINRTDMPAVLVELAFISNEVEEDLLNNNIEAFAKAVADGILEYVSTL